MWIKRSDEYEDENIRRRFKGFCGRFRMHGTVPRIRQAVEEKEAVSLFREAEEMGYTFFDTAEVYGTADDPHVNEELVGKAIETGTQQSGDSY